MRVLALVTDAFGGRGGIALYNRDFLTALCEHQDISEVVAIARCADQFNDVLPPKLTYDVSGVSGSLAFLNSVWRVLTQKRNFNFILCCHINLMPLAWLIGKLHKLPVILEIYGIEAWQPSGRWLSETLSRSAFSVVSISEYTRVRFLSWSKLVPSKCKILPNAIHVEKYSISGKSSALVERYGLHGKRVLLTFGRIVSKERAKGFDEVLDLLPELLIDNPDIVYLIAGDGEYSSALKEKVLTLGLSEYVVFTGMVVEEEKSDIYSLADVYVMPSRGEGFGFVFLEAMACGIPVIASRVDGSREAVLDGELGAVVNPDDPAEIRGAIVEALKKPREIPEGLTYFSFHNFTVKLHKIIDEMMVSIK